MAVMPRVEQPKIEIERKIGNTTYIVNGFFASQRKFAVLLDI